MGRIGITEILLISIVFILFFGTKKLPEMGAAIGQAIREFQRAVSGKEEEPKKTPAPDAKNESK